MATIRLLRLPDVLDATGESRSALYAKISKGLFPRPVKIGARASAWPSVEISELNSARIAGKPEAEIRDLVELLHAQRTGA
jgi:prophage regulatory protein